MSYVLDTNIQTNTIYLDSTNCVSRNPYFKYDLATGITCPTACRMLLSVQSISLPNVINTITEKNNQLSIRIMTSGGVSVLIYTLTFPIGISSAWAVRDYINSQTVGPYNAVQCIYDEKSFRFKFVSTFNFEIVSTENRPTTCGALIGLGKDDSNNFIFPETATAPFYTLIMPSTVNFIATPYVFLKINNFTLTNINSFGIISNSLVRFPVNCEYGQIIQYRPTEVNRFLINRNDITSIEMYLEDIYNNKLSIPNGVELQVILKFEYVYPASEKMPYDAGTIQHYFKTNPPPEVEEFDEEAIGNV